MPFKVKESSDPRGACTLYFELHVRNSGCVVDEPRTTSTTPDPPEPATYIMRKYYTEFNPSGRRVGAGVARVRL